MIEVEVHFKEHSTSLEVDRVLAPTDVFRYWTFWYPADEKNRVRVRFIKEDYVMEVNMVGEPEEEHLASVTPIHPVVDPEDIFNPSEE